MRSFRVSKQINLKDQEVQRILASLQASKDVFISLSPGDAIRVMEGPFSNLSELVEEVDAERGTIRAQINIFSRNTPVELEFSQVEKL